MKIKHNSVDEVTDVMFASATDKQCPVMCEALSCWFVTIDCSVTQLYHNLYRLTPTSTLLASEAEYKYRGCVLHCFSSQS